MFVIASFVLELRLKRERKNIITTVMNMSMAKNKRRKLHRLSKCNTRGTNKCSNPVMTSRKQMKSESNLRQVACN